MRCGRSISDGSPKALSDGNLGAENAMRVDFTAFFHELSLCMSRNSATDAEVGQTFHRLMQALVRFDDTVIFAYRGKARPLDLFSTFDATDHHVFVTLYQAGPYLL